MAVKFEIFSLDNGYCYDFRRRNFHQHLSRNLSIRHERQASNHGYCCHQEQSWFLSITETKQTIDTLAGKVHCTRRFGGIMKVEKMTRR